MQTLRQVLAFQQRYNAHVTQYRMEQAKSFLGEKWLLHPANRVSRKMDDAATRERQRFIGSVRT